MLRFKTILSRVVLVTSLVAGPLHAQEPLGTAGSANLRALTLERLEDLAEQSHPLLRRSTARIESARGAELQAGLYPNPRFDTNNPEVFAGRNSQFSAGFMQEIVVKGKLRLDRAAAARGVQQAEFNYVQEKFSLLTDVRKQFYATLAAQRRVDVLGRLLRITDSSLETAEKRLKAGEADKAEVLLLKIDNAKVKAQLDNARYKLEGERRKLSAIVGFPGFVNTDLVGSLSAPFPSFDEDLVQQFVASENAQVQIAKLDIDKSKLQLERAEAEPYPNITVGPTYQWSPVPGNDLFGLTVTFPIPFTDRNQGNIRAARANIHTAVETLGTVQLELLKQVADSYSQYRGAVEQAQKYRDQILPDSVDAMKLAKIGYDQGIFDFSSYLQAQRTVMETNSSYLDVLETAWKAAAELAGLLQREQFP